MDFSRPPPGYPASEAQPAQPTQPQVGNQTQMYHEFPSHHSGFNFLGNSAPAPQPQMGHSSNLYHGFPSHHSGINLFGNAAPALQPQMGHPSTLYQGFPSHHSGINLFGNAAPAPQPQMSHPTPFYHYGHMFQPVPPPAVINVTHIHQHNEPKVPGPVEPVKAEKPKESLAKETPFVSKVISIKEIQENNELETASKRQPWKKTRQVLESSDDNDSDLSSDFDKPRPMALKWKDEEPKAGPSSVKGKKRAKKTMKYEDSKREDSKREDFKREDAKREDAKREYATRQVLDSSDDNDSDLSSDLDKPRPLALKWKDEEPKAGPSSVKGKKRAKKTMKYEDSKREDAKREDTESDQDGTPKRKRTLRGYKGRPKSPEMCKNKPDESAVIIISDDEADSLPDIKMTYQNAIDKEEEDEEICPICFVNIRWEERARVVHFVQSKCHARGCTGCVTQWVAEHQNCSVRRGEAKDVTVVPFYE